MHPMFIPFSHVYLPIPANKKVLTQKCHFSTSQGDKTPNYKGGQEKSWHQLKQSTIFGEFHDKPPFKITTQHTCIVCSVSISPPKIKDIPMFTNKNMGLVSWTKLCVSTLRRVNWTQQTSRGRSPWPPGLSPQRPGRDWDWDWLDGGFQKYSKMGWKFMVGELNWKKNICQVWWFRVWNIWIDQRFFLISIECKVQDVVYAVLHGR